MRAYFVLQMMLRGGASEVSRMPSAHCHLVAGLPQLTCLCLRQCFAMPPAALQTLRLLTALRALDLDGLPQASGDYLLPRAARDT